MNLFTIRMRQYWIQLLSGPQILGIALSALQTLSSSILRKIYVTKISILPLKMKIKSVHLTLLINGRAIAKFMV